VGDVAARALDLLRGCAGPGGFVASPQDVANYRRVWARDGVVCGLAAVVGGDESLLEGLGATLRTLAAHQDAQGRVPSNVGLTQPPSVSYGGLVGRLDAPAWFVIGVGHYVGASGDREFAQAMAPHAARALALLSCWDHNGRGLLYAPPGADWADELDVHGHTLGLNLLRLWALRSHARCYGDEASATLAARLAETIDRELWPRGEVSPEEVRHPPAWAVRLEAPVTHWQASFGPLGYDARFDALGNALAVLLGLGDARRRHQALTTGQALAGVTKLGLVPAFWPPVFRDDPRWRGLTQAHAGQLRNHPHEYHNGGVWPFVNGFWGLALLAGGREADARALRDRVAALCQAGDGFCEFAHAKTGAPGGVTPIAWSAAGLLLLDAALAGKTLAFEAAS
jgi:hypothetical protein